MSTSENFGAFLGWWHAQPKHSHPFLVDKGRCKPATLGPLTPNIAMFRYNGPYDLVSLYVGSEMERLSGSKTGRGNYYDRIDPASKEALHHFHMAVFGVPCGAYVADLVTLDSGAKYLFEFMMFPLANDDGKATHAVAYGHGRIAADTTTDQRTTLLRKRDDHSVGNIKNQHFFDLGGGAPENCIIDFQAYDRPPKEMT